MKISSVVPTYFADFTQFFRRFRQVRCRKMTPQSTISVATFLICNCAAERDFWIRLKI